MPASATQRAGARAEQRALEFLEQAGLELVDRNVASPLGEIDLVMRAGDELVFVEVRSRADLRFGGAAASVTEAKRRRLRRSANRYLLERYGRGRWPACRFDVVALEAGRIEWIRAAFA